MNDTMKLVLALYFLLALFEFGFFFKCQLSKRVSKNERDIEDLRKR